MCTERILLDTTIQIWRIAFNPEEAENIHRELEGKVVYTTSFVFREFLNTLISDLRYVHNQASDVLQPGGEGRVGLDRLARFLATGKGNYSARSIQRLHLVMGSLLESFDQTRVSKNRILVRLERTANRWIRDFFRYPKRNGEMGSVVCLTGLDDSSAELERMRTGKPFPPAPPFPKGAAAFLDRTKAQVTSVEVIMKQATKAQGRDDRLLKVLERLKGKDGVFDFKDKLGQYKAWNWALGDLLIALETPGGVAIYSTDRAFRILTQALDKPRHLGYRTPVEPPRAVDAKA